MHDEVEARETQAAALVCYWRVGAVWHRRGHGDVIARMWRHGRG